MVTAVLRSMPIVALGPGRGRTALQREETRRHISSNEVRVQRTLALNHATEKASSARTISIPQSEQSVDLLLVVAIVSCQRQRRQARKSRAPCSLPRHCCPFCKFTVTREFLITVIKCVFLSQKDQRPPPALSETAQNRKRKIRFHWLVHFLFLLRPDS